MAGCKEAIQVARQGHDQTLDVPPLDDPSLDDPSLGDPSLGDPSLDDPSLDDASLDDPSLDDPPLDDPPLDDPSLDDLLDDLSSHDLSLDDSVSAIDVNSLDIEFNNSYSQNKTVADLSEEVEFSREMLDKTPKSGTRRAFMLKFLGNTLSDRYTATNVMSDLEEAIELTRQAVDMISDDPGGTFSIRLAIHLGKRYSATGAIADVEEAIHLARQAVNLAAQDDLDPAKFRTVLGGELSKRYSATGALADLEEAIDVSRQAINLTKDYYPDWAGELNNLAVQLSQRYSRIGAIADLDEAIDLTRQAVSTALEDSEDLALFLGNLGSLLSDRFLRTNAKADIAESVLLARQSVDITPVNHSVRASRLHHLGSQLGFKASATASATQALVDCEEAIKFHREALDAESEHSPSRPIYLSALGAGLGSKFRMTGAMADLDEAIHVSRQAVDARSPNNSIRARLLNSLGDLLCDRYTRTGAMTDREEAVVHFQSALSKPSSHTSDRIYAGTAIIRFCPDWHQAYEASRLAVSLIPGLIARSLENSDKQHVLSQVVGLASDAAAMALRIDQVPLVSLNLLEQGRGVLGASLEEMRTDILGLQEGYPKLAEQFVSLRNELQAPVNVNPPFPRENRTFSSQDQQMGHYDAAKKFDELVDEIRKLPDLESFLLPPKETEIQAAARYGPIAVINVSECRCDALLVEKHRVRALALASLTKEEIDRKANGADLGSPQVLEWLWDAVTGPILDALELTQSPSDNNWPHVWWVPTGPLSRFPLHAAGYHRKGNGETVLDRVMSSYGSSIKAVIYGRRRKRPAFTRSTPARALLVSMEHTPGSSRLPFAKKEIAMLHSLCKSMPFNPIEPGRRKQDVMSNLVNCKIFHFAGHGYTDKEDPSKSCLLLEDWKDDPLTVASLLGSNHRENSPFLAYLSACGTGRIKDEKFVDESIHLISAFQLAGFRHVIGTLWDVNDELCVEMAKITYEKMSEGGVTDKSVCLGLHIATRELRDRWLKMPAKARRGSRPIKKVRILSAMKKTEAQSGNDVHPRNAGLQRDAVPCYDDDDDDDDDDNEGRGPLYWVSYVHFGV